jgi:hypothetical protein
MTRQTVLLRDICCAYCPENNTLSNAIVKTISHPKGTHSTAPVNALKKALSRGAQKRTARGKAC